MLALTFTTSIVRPSYLTTSLLDWPSQQKKRIHQGNYLTDTAIAKPHPGPNRSQVFCLLGFPLLTEPFHENRCDYIYRNTKRRERQEKNNRLLSPSCNGDVLAGVVSQAQPAEPSMLTTAPTSQDAKP